MKKFLALILTLLLAVGIVGCNKGDGENTITVGASATPHAEILEILKEDLKAQGFTLKIKVFNDYVLPNTAVESGEITANYFQHVPYLEEFNRERGTHLVSVVKVHYEAFAVYSKNYRDIASVPQTATVAVPNDPTNCARALLLLQEQGLIVLRGGGNITSTKEDILPESKLGKNNVKTLAAEFTASALNDTDLTVINGNYALTGEVNREYAIAQEGATVGAAQFANVLCVKQGNENLPKVVALKNALTSKKVADFIQEKYKGFVGIVFTPAE